MNLRIGARPVSSKPYLETWHRQSRRKRRQQTGAFFILLPWHKKRFVLWVLGTLAGTIKAFLAVFCSWLQSGLYGYDTGRAAVDGTNFICANDKLEHRKIFYFFLYIPTVVELVFDQIRMWMTRSRGLISPTNAKRSRIRASSIVTKNSWPRLKSKVSPLSVSIDWERTEAHNFLEAGFTIHFICDTVS